MKLLFLGKLEPLSEFPREICRAWARVLGPFSFVAFSNLVSESGGSEDAAINKIAAQMKEFQPDILVLWNAVAITETGSRSLRKICDASGVKFHFISYDDPFFLIVKPHRGYVGVHRVFTNCLASTQKYKGEGLEAEWLLPACSYDAHIVPSKAPDKIVSAICFFISNFYNAEVFQSPEVRAFDRLKAMRAILEKHSVHLYSWHTLKVPEELKSNPRFISYGFLRYDDFHSKTQYKVHFNSTVTPGYPQTNQRLFEILGIGGVQVHQHHPLLEKFFTGLFGDLAAANSPILLYKDMKELLEKVDLLMLESDAQTQRRQFTARLLRYLWTYDRFVMALAGLDVSPMAKFQKANSV